MPCQSLFSIHLCQCLVNHSSAHISVNALSIIIHHTSLVVPCQSLFTTHLCQCLVNHSSANISVNTSHSLFSALFYKGHHSIHCSLHASVNAYTIIVQHIAVPRWPQLLGSTLLYSGDHNYWAAHCYTVVTTIIVQHIALPRWPQLLGSIMLYKGHHNH